MTAVQYPTGGRHSVAKELYLPKPPELPSGPNPLPAYAAAVSASWGRLTFVVQEFARQVGIVANREVIQRSGGAMTGGFAVARTSPAYGPSVAINARVGNEFDVTATNATAFTVANPTNPVDGLRLTITIRNTSGGALGVVTWDTQYKLAAWTSPATGFSRSIDFRFDGTNWVEVSRTPADVPN